MATSFTYPGVYIQELSSGVHTITGVATSITAFAGWAPQGPVLEATLVKSWEEYQTQFGGLDARSLLGYAVNQFFNNGGQQAYIVRLVWDGSVPASAGTTPAVAQTASAIWQKFGVANIIATDPTTGVTGSAALAVGAAVASVTISPSSTTALTLAPNQTLQLTATGALTDGTTLPLSGVVWTTSAPTGTVPAISSTGLVTAGAAAGSAEFTANETGGASFSVTVTVVATTPPALTAIAIAPLAATPIPIGKTIQLTATGTYADGTTGDVTTTATWTSSNTAFFNPVSLGVFTAVATGSVIVTAAIGSVQQTIAVAVGTGSVALSSIRVTPSPATVPLGTQQFSALGIFSDGSQIDLTKVATWNAGSGTISSAGQLSVTAIPAANPITVRASLGATTGSATATITAKVLQSVVVTAVNQGILSGTTSQFKATGTYSDQSTADITSSVTWSSSSPSIATVAASGGTAGLATAVSNGSSMTLFAANPGLWGSSLRITIAVQPPPNDTRFSLLLQQLLPNGNLQTLESYSNLSVTATDPMYVVKVIDNDSNYLSFIDPSTSTVVVPTGTPAPTPSRTPLALSGGADGGVLTPATDGNFELMLLNQPNGVYLLDRVSIFNLLCIPAETDAPTIQLIQSYCNDKRAFYIIDPPQLATISGLTSTGPVGSTSGSITGTWSDHSAYYFPWVEAPDPLFGNRITPFPPCGFVAGIYASTDASRGVWKAPAGIDAGLTGVSGLQYTLTDIENGDLNTQGINCLREFRVYGDVVWGARTLQGSDLAGSQWKYIPIRRFALYLESSLYDGLQWVVFEPNDDTLWGQIRLNVNAFMQGLFLQGAFQGTTPQQAYFVKCDADNNPQANIDQGIVTVLVGFAPLYPAEFVLIQIQQLAGQSS